MGSSEPSVRVLGSLHSCSDICVSDLVIDVSLMPKTIEFAADDTQVTASANWELHEFFYELSKRGKSLGALGAIGIITRAQFRTIDEPYFAATMKLIPMAEAMDDVDATSAEYDFWRVNWVPDSDKALLWAAKQIPSDQAGAEGDYDTDEADNVLQFLFMLWDRISRGSAGPLLDSPMKVIYRFLNTFYNLNQVNVTGPLRNMLPADRRAPLRVAMAEWAFRPDDMDAILTLCERSFEQHGWPNIPTEIELSKTDPYLMSPWN